MIDNNITARLRAWSADESTWDLLTEAADEIERLRAALTQANRTLVAAFNRIHCLPRTTDTELATKIAKTRVAICAALEGEKKDD